MRERRAAREGEGAMRFVLYVMAAGVLVALGWNLAQSGGMFAAGFYRPLDTRYSLLALAAMGLLATRIGERGWAPALVGLAAVVGAAALTPQGFRLPEVWLLTVGGLLVLGLLGALDKGPGPFTGALVLAVAGLAHGQLMTQGVAGAKETQFLAGLALGVAAVLMIAMAVAEGAEQMSKGSGAKLSAGVAGVGAYLTAGHFNLL